MGAPVSVVAAAQEALGCQLTPETDPDFPEYVGRCGQHPRRWWRERGCPAAVEAADAAWAAAYPAALRDAAGRFRFTDEDIENAVEAMQEGEWTWFQWLFRETLRRWADESEAAK